MPDSLMSRLPLEDFTNRDYNSIKNVISMARAERYYQLEEAKKKPQRSSSTRKSSTRSTKPKTQKSDEQKLLDAMAKLSPTQLAKLKASIGES